MTARIELGGTPRGGVQPAIDPKREKLFADAAARRPYLWKH
jgi:hypothetical protein